MKQTAVEWLFDHLVPHLHLSKVEDRELFRKLKAEAKSMEKEQIHDALEVGYLIAYEDVKFKHIQTTEQYYNETYGGKNEI